MRMRQLGKFTLGNNATLRLEARAWLMVSSMSAQSGSAPGTGEKTNGLVRLTLQEGVSTSQLASRLFTSWTASGNQACQVGS